MSIEVVKLLIKENPALKEEIRKVFFSDTKLTKKQRKTNYQKQIEEASLSWMPKFVR